MIVSDTAIDSGKGDTMCTSSSSSSSNGSNSSYSTPEKNGGTTSQLVTPTTTTADLYAPTVSNGVFKSASGETNGFENGSSSSSSSSSSNDNGLHSCDEMTEAKKNPASKGRSSLFRLFRFLLWNGPMLACWSLLLVSMLMKEVWSGPLQTLLQSFKLNDESNSLDLNPDLDHELTYYHRRCDHRDISTHDANDLLVNPNMTLKKRQEIVMTHGAVVMKDILSHPTARELRAYLETRHHEFHSNDLKLPWDELFWDGDGGSRLSLGLGPEDASIVSRAIAEVGSNSELKRTLEATLGKDPAVVEVSTLSTMHDAEPQGIHTDSDYFGSSVLYTRSFLHSYTMFISLQDTTSRMGATTICPGTHWCADEDLSALCQCNYLDEDDEEEEHIGYCNTFEASSNGKTGLEVGVLQRGDAMMFNQNIWHRGPRNYDAKRKENRAMFIMTFVSRRDFEKGDNRQQGWGTYYYMRHSMWGHLFSDLKTAASGGMDLFKNRIWKAYGLIGSSKKGNLPWLEHWARMMSNHMDFFMDSEVEDFQIMLRDLTKENRLARWLFLENDQALRQLFENSAKFDEYGEIQWRDYLELLIQSAHHQSRKLFFTVAAATMLAKFVGYILYCLIWGIWNWMQKGQNSSSFSSFEAPRPIRDVSSSIGRLVVAHALVLGIAVACRHYVLYKAPLFERIHTGDVHFKAFPPLPFETVVEDEYNEYGERIGKVEFDEELLPVEVLIEKQDAEQREFRRSHPKHPYSYYFEKERERFKQSQQRSLVSSAGTALPVIPKPPVQASAFPERNDVLIGSRFDADFLASMNHVLDFHPGTKDWIRLMKEHKDIVSETSDEAYIDMAVDTIVSKILYKNDGSSLSLLSVEGGTPRRFLKQDHETAWWVVMTKSEAITATKKSLLAMAHPLSIGVLQDHWKQVLAESRFGKRRHTVLAKKWIPPLVQKMTKELFSAYEKQHERIVSPMGIARNSKGVVTNGEQGTILLPSTARGLLPKSMITGKSALSLTASVPLLRPEVLSVRAHLRAFMKSVVTLKIGDHVLFKGSDVQDLMFQATIISINTKEKYLEIQPLRWDEVEENFDEVTLFVTQDDIQYYRPAAETDLVWSLTEDPDGENDGWKIYEILYLTPFGQVEMEMTSEYAGRFRDDEDEPFENKPLSRDYKEFMLVDDQIPFIRLRQHN